jgi:hypothetical protein
MHLINVCMVAYVTRSGQFWVIHLLLAKILYEETVAHRHVLCQFMAYTRGCINFGLSNKIPEILYA